MGAGFKTGFGEWPVLVRQPSGPASRDAGRVTWLT